MTDCERNFNLCKDLTRVKYSSLRQLRTKAITNSYLPLVFSPEGVKLDYRAFDLLDNSTVQNTMTEFLNKQPQGSIIAAGISDAISPNTEISDATFQAFEAFGAKQIRSRNFRDSYALIGVKGGDAVENYAVNGTVAATSREFKTST